VTTAITIALADDHRVVRQGLRALLEAEPGFRVIGEAGDGLEAVRLVERLSPRVLVVDLMMPSLGGLEIARQVSRRAPGTRVVILSMYGDEGYVVEALRNGALGYVLKDATVAHLVRAIREAAAGRRYVSPPLSRRAMKADLEKAKDAPRDAYDTLTTREREVLHLAAEGYTSDPLRRHVKLIETTAARAGALTQQLLAFSRKQVLQPRFLDLNLVAADMAKILRRLIREDIELVIEQFTEAVRQVGLYWLLVNQPPPPA
jgi:DNA-binding NarL/FixJ family response regulator